MAYCSAEAAAALIPGVDLGVLGDGAAQTVALEAAAGAASAEVDARCRRTFEPPGEAETRYFDGPGGLLLRVPDLTRLDGVCLDGAPATEAAAYPLDGPPFLWVALGRRIPAGQANVEVTGLWGYGPSVPEDVGRATACLAAADILVRLQADRSGGVQTQVTGLAREEFPEGGPHGETIRTLTNIAGRLLLPYRRWVV